MQTPLETAYGYPGPDAGREAASLLWGRLHGALAHCEAILSWTAQQFYPKTYPIDGRWRSGTNPAAAQELEVPEHWSGFTSGPQPPRLMLDQAWLNLRWLSAALQGPETAAMAAADLQHTEIQLSLAKAAIQTLQSRDGPEALFKQLPEPNTLTPVFLDFYGFDQDICYKIKERLLAEMGWNTLMFVPSEDSIVHLVRSCTNGYSV